MKKLFLIRHAKSSWEDLSLDDFNRPLNNRGNTSANLMGNLLKNQNIIPNLIYSSSALRDKKTTQIISKILETENKILYFDELYDCELETIWETIKQTKESAETIFLVGHNPELNDFATFIAGFDEHLPTCGIIEIWFDVNKWNDISKKNSQYKSFNYPKLLEKSQNHR